MFFLKSKLMINNSTQNVWIILYYSEPNDKLIFIKPNFHINYTISEKVIRGNIEHYVIFDDFSDETTSEQKFVEQLIELVKNCNK